MTHTPAIFCGGEPSEEDLKVVRRFAKFLRDPENRCPVCMHKISSHSATRCRATGCTDCNLSKDHIRNYWTAHNLVEDGMTELD